MRHFRRLGFLLLTLSAASGLAQLAPEQRVADMEHLAALYAKNYAPYEWKRDTQGFDLLDLKPWLEKARAAKNDLEFYDVLVAYVASLNDAHSGYAVPSSFSASLNFSADIYDGKVLVDSINRTRLPASDYPFQIGWEVVSVDGVGVEELMTAFTKYSISANPRSTRRTAASLLTLRPQQLMPGAVDLGDSATVVLRAPEGETRSFVIPWVKSGLPLRRVGPVPVLPGLDGASVMGFGDEADYLAPLRALEWARIRDNAVLGFGARAPIFAPPSGFVQRLGRLSSDAFYSGTFRAGGYNIGFIRIPSYSPANTTLALQQFFSEMAYFEQNTDGLVIDEMRNPGGSVSYCNTLIQMLMPRDFRVIGFEVRATSDWVASISSSVESARAQGAPQSIIDLLVGIQDQIVTANKEMRGRTGPIALDDVSLDRQPLTDGMGNVMAYTKPLMVLIDEFSASGGDLFPATIQLNGRGKLFGMRTMGAGGSVASARAGAYSEGSTNITLSLMNRGEAVSIDGYPATPYIENVGVHPDIAADYMTRENLLNAGGPFVRAFVDAMVEQIRKGQ